MNDSAARLRCAVLSAVKHDYVARGVASHPRFELVVVADDADQPAWAHERNQLFADELQVPYVRDVEQALQSCDIDVAIVSSAAERHADLSCRAAQLGVHVIQDKPLATRHEDMQRLVETIQQTGVRFLMWNRNFFPAVQHAWRQVSAGAIGELRAMHVDFYFAKDAGVPKGTRQPGYPPLDWLSHQLAAHVDGSDGGLGQLPIGELTNEGIYPLGYMQLLSEREVRRVFARRAWHFHQLNADNRVEDLATVTLEFEGGLIGSIALGRIGAASHPSGGEIRLHLLGSQGALVVNEARPDIGLCYRQQPLREARQRRVANENDLLLADNFARAVDQQGDTLMNVQASSRIFRVIEAALQSCRTGQPANVC